MAFVDFIILYDNLSNGHLRPKLAECQFLQILATECRKVYMQPNSQKNRQLLGQYPFLKAILAQAHEPHASGDRPLNTIDSLTIKVEKADGDLMFKQACNTGLGEASSFIGMGERQGQSGKQGEYLFAVSKDGKLIRVLSWPRNDDERRGLGYEVYGWQVLWGHREEDLFQHSLHEDVEWIVQVGVSAWFDSTKDVFNPFGEFRSRNVHVIVYSKPKEGFMKLHESSSVYENLYLDSKVLMRGMFHKNTDILTINGQLSELCCLFQDEVYFNGMKEVLDAGKFRGASGQLGPVKVLAVVMCGYDRVMIETPNAWASFQLRPGAKSLYVLGVGGTLPRIRNMVRTACKLWNTNSGARKSFKSDANVSVM